MSGQKCSEKQEQLGIKQYYWVLSTNVKSMQFMAKSA